ncbi:MAG: endonuclease/exonuclease/phosphatase family protein [Pirellulales bacterium]|nr:endonuclease/exonuclease/phosphatase family protein [Pirellulales bacterium]
MRKGLMPLLLLAGVVAAGVYTGKIDIASLKKLGTLATSVVTSGGSREETIPAASGDTIRIASFNIQVFGTAKFNKPEVVDILARVVRMFDVVAIQEVRSADETLLPRFVDLVNSTGRHYEYVIGPRLGRTSSKEQYAFVFDSERIEVDRRTVYTVNDPADRLHREPLVAEFRVRGVPTNEAFTFKLVNIHTDPDEVPAELEALADALQAVRRDGSGEDDVLVLGDLNADDDHYGALRGIYDLTWALSRTPTNTQQNHMYDNLLFDRNATGEFLGRSGVLNLRSEFGLSLDQALAVSDHLPVWGEFSAYEGGGEQRLATRPDEARPR